ncbi:MAG: hypothetical protein ACLQUY_12660 [Ktedonobacterales bacterium]
MDTSVGIDWCDYLHCLSDDQMRELATWLAAESLKVSEFTDIVDRVYAQASENWRGRSPAFVASYGRPIMQRYARRRRGFAEALAAVEDAKMSGALPGDFASQELQPLRLPQSEPRSVEDVLSALQRVRANST